MKSSAHMPVKMSSDDRAEAIGALHREHARELERRVARRARAGSQTIEDACAFAWLQLLTREHVDLAPSSAGALAWLTQTATREASRLEGVRRRDGLVDDVALTRWLDGRRGRGADEIAAQRARIELVGSIAVRPRRFLWRLALGHSYSEIAADERVSVRTTDRQVARAKRTLRMLDAA
jgi:DNA-directed RNA polymerase specialized sigma24 family protein